MADEIRITKHEGGTYENGEEEKIQNSEMG